MKRFREETVKIFMVLMFTLLPLFYTDNYYNILHDKRKLFWRSSAVMLAVVILSLLVSMVLDIRKKKLVQTIKEEIHYINLLDVVMVVFAGLALVSACMSGYLNKSLVGGIAWDVGALIIGLGTGVYVAVSRWFRCRSDVWVYVYLGTFAVLAIGIIDRLGYDFLVMHDEIPLQYNIFISTIGNVNFWAAYLSILVPFFMLAPIFCKGRFSRGCIYLFLLAAYFSLYITLTNTTYIGIGCAGLFIIYFSLKDMKRLKNLAMNGILFTLAGVIAEMLWKNPITPRPIDTDSITLLLLDYRLYLVPGILGGAVLVFLFIVHGIQEKKQEKVRVVVEKVLPVLWLIIVCLGIIGGVIYLVCNYNLELFNYRGSIWYFSFLGFLDGDLQQKLLGVGPGLLDVVAQEQIAKADFYVEWDYYYNTAHNDLLEYLVTMGIPGAVLKLMMYILPFWMYAKGEAYKSEKAAVLAGLVGFIGQGLVTGPYILTFVIYVIFLGVMGAYWRRGRLLCNSREEKEQGINEFE